MKMGDVISVSKLLLEKSRSIKPNNPSSFYYYLPNEISFKITTRCTFRCKHCYLWNNNGYYRQFNTKETTQDIELEIFNKVLSETRESNSSIRISGGEPLVHHNFPELITMLAKFNRKITLFTNGFLLNKHIDQILKISRNLNIVISLDGMTSEHENIRGKNTFVKVIKNIQLLIDLKRQGQYHGRITINSFISNDLIPNISEFIEFICQLDIDKFFLNFPWFLDKVDVNKMDIFYKDNFSQICNKTLPGSPSWHTFTYQLTSENLRNALIILKSYKKIIINNGVRINPFSEYTKIVDEENFKNKLFNQIPIFCTAISNSMIIQPDGMVSACTAFPEIELGLISKRSVKEIWNSEKFNSIRKIINNSLLPGKACSKCPYLSSNFYNL